MNWYAVWGEAVLRRYEARERVQRRKRTFAWEKMDEELIPKVRETIALLQGDGMTRPQRVTVSAVTKRCTCRIRDLRNCRGAGRRLRSIQNRRRNTGRGRQYGRIGNL